MRIEHRAVEQLDLSASIEAKLLVLSKRQAQVLRLIAVGYTAEEIGVALGISRRTARLHSDALRAKLGVARVRQAPLAYRRLTGHDPILGLPAIVADAGTEQLQEKLSAL